MTETISHRVIKELKFPTAKIEFWESGIVYIEIEDNTEVDLEISRKHFQALKDHYDGVHQFYVLVEPGKFTTLTKEAREFSAKPESNAMTNAMAVLVNSLAQRIIINFQSRFVSRQKIKVKAFQSKPEAIEWLLERKRIDG